MPKVPKCPDDTAEVLLGQPSPPTQPPSVDPAVLRRALKYGQKAREFMQALPFRDAEAELRVGWEKKGEVIEWEWVRAAVRAGYELEPQDDV
jgi:hypothetical protein